jgi:hypothetical protein
VVQVTRPGLYRLQREDGSKVPNSWNDDQLSPFLYVIKFFVVYFLLLPAALAQEANTSVRGLHYALIYVSYNEIYTFCCICFIFVQTTSWPQL